MNIVFWGTGSGGLNLFSFCKRIDIEPNYFCSSDSLLWHKEFCGISVVSPNELKEIPLDIIYIACSAVNEVRLQIASLNLSKELIVVDATFCYSTDFFRFNKSRFDKLFCECKSIVNSTRLNGCYIDLSDGPSRSGISDWAIQFHEVLYKNNIPSHFVIREMELTSDNKMEYFYNNKFSSFLNDTSDILLPYKCILNGDYRTVVCNFVQNFFIAACYAKKKLGKLLKVVLIIHNQLPIYYSNAVMFCDYIDECYVISDYIANKLEQLGFPKSKIRLLQWGIYLPVIKNNRKMNGPLRIGYAGRIVIEQKRIDLIIKVATQLAKNKVDFVLSIAGTGRDSVFFKEEIKRLNLEQFVILEGFVNKDNIHDFWGRQDVFLSCSDYEGHSISQVEALCSGVVPVVTDVSGVRDDIIQNVMGFICPVGDYISIASCIKSLAQDRLLLKKMSEACIKNRNKFDIKNVEINYLEII